MVDKYLFKSLLPKFKWYKILKLNIFYATFNPANFRSSNNHLSVNVPPTYSTSTRSSPERHTVYDSVEVQQKMLLPIKIFLTILIDIVVFKHTHIYIAKLLLLTFPMKIVKTTIFINRVVFNSTRTTLTDSVVLVCLCIFLPGGGLVEVETCGTNVASDYLFIIDCTVFWTKYCIVNLLHRMWTKWSFNSFVSPSADYAVFYA
jgi:hypothetical protein